MQLTAKQVAAIKPQEKKKAYDDGNGLRLVVYPSGSKNWILRRPVNGKRKETGLGGYPAVSLANARAEATLERSGQKLATTTAGQRVRKLRKSKGMSTIKLAAAASKFGPRVSQQSITDLEKGHVKDARRLPQIAKALCTTFEYLVGETDNPLPQDVRVTEKEQLELLRAIKKDLEEIKAVLEIKAIMKRVSS
jgi:transcriptional regulator with XRE-family HTH domain